MANTYKQDKLDLQVCWNCRNYCSFSGICQYHGIAKSILDECEKFDVDGYKEKVESLENENKGLIYLYENENIIRKGLENEIAELKNQIKMLKDEHDTLQEDYNFIRNGG